MANVTGKPEDTSKPLPETPTCNCLLLCDDVLISNGKGKHYLQGIIGVVRVPIFPVIIGGYVAYVRFSNWYPSQEITIKLAHGDTDESIFEFRVTSQAQTDPLGVYTVVAPIPLFRVEKPGRYVFSAVSRGEPIAQSPILVEGPPEEKEEQP